MDADERLVRAALEWNKRRLMRVWSVICAGKEVADFPPGRALEFLVLRAFQLEGADVRWPYRVRLAGELVEQIDGAAHVATISTLVEAKVTQGPISIEPIAKLRNQLLRRPAATVGSVFSLKGFTLPAKMLTEFMAPQTILLWERDEIDLAVRESCFCKGLIAKVRYAAEANLTDFKLVPGAFP